MDNTCLFVYNIAIDKEVQQKLKWELTPLT